MNQFNLPSQQIVTRENDGNVFFDKNPMPMWVLNLQSFKFLAVNEMAIAQYGYSREEFLSMTSLDLQSETGSPSNHLLEISSASYTKGIAQHVKKNGEVITVEITAQQMVYDGITAKLVVSNDINERMKAEKEFTLNKDRFLAFMENSSEGISLSDEKSNVIYRSRSTVKILGNNKLINVLKLVHPDDLQNIQSVKKQIAHKPGVPFPFEARFMHEQGHYIWLEGTWTNMLQVPGVNAYVANFRDITARKESEEKIRSSEKNLLAIFANTSEGFVLVDADGIVKAFNNRAKRSVLLNMEEDIRPGRHILDFVPPARKGYFAKVMASVMSGKAVQYDRSYDNGGGKTNWISYSFQPVWDEGLITGICITGRDITDRKIAEQQRDFDQNNLYALINNTDDLLWSVDREFKLITSNDSFDQMVKYFSGSIPRKGTNVLQSGFDEEQLNEYRGYYERAFTGESFTVIVYTKFPQDFWSEISFYPIYEGDSVIGTACFSRNITEKKRAEKVILQTQRRLEQSQAISHIGHWEVDLNNLTCKWSAETFRIFGLEPSNRELSADYWISFIHPHDVKRVEEEIEKSNLTCTDYSLNCRIISNDGRIRHVHSECRYELNDKGLPLTAYGTIQDMTRNREAEEQLMKNSHEKELLVKRVSTILNTLPASIVLLDADGMIVDVNDSWRNFSANDCMHIYNYGVGDSYINIPENANDNNSDRAKIIAGIRNVLNGSAENFLFEYSCQLQGIKRWFRMFVTPLNAKDCAGAVIMHIDISELRRLEEERLSNKTEEQRKITRAMLQGQEEERNAIGIELHDNVNQILVSTNMLLQMGKDESPRITELFKRCINNITTAINENRKIAHELVTPDMGGESLVQQLTILMRGMLEPQGIKQNIYYDGFNESLLSSEQKLAIYRVAQEQCTNIIKHAAASSVVFSLSTEKGKLLMQIKDDGKGMCVKKIAHGIGLKNIFGRVNVFGGQVKIDSSPGNGFTLEIEMP